MLSSPVGYQGGFQIAPHSRAEPVPSGHPSPTAPGAGPGSGAAHVGFRCLVDSDPHISTALFGHPKSQSLFSCRKWLIPKTCAPHCLWLIRAVDQAGPVQYRESFWHSCQGTGRDQRIEKKALSLSLVGYWCKSRCIKGLVAQWISNRIQSL